jgi:hypothetical protein
MPQGRNATLSGFINFQSAVQLEANARQAAYVGSPEWTVNGTWFTDASTPTGQERIFTTVFGSSIKATFQGDELDVTVQVSTGWGVMGVYGLDGRLLGEINCNIASADLNTQTLRGFGPGVHTVILKKLLPDGLFIVLVGLAWAPPEGGEPISTMPEALALDGTEIVPGLQNATNVAMTTQQIATLAAEQPPFSVGSVAATAGAATLNTTAGAITAAISSAGTYVLTLTNSVLKTDSVMLWNAYDSDGNAWAVTALSITAGGAGVTFTNLASASSGTLNMNFLSANPAS